MSIELTTDELVDLYMLCDREADMFDYDAAVSTRFTELAEKLSKMVAARKAEAL